MTNLIGQTKQTYFKTKFTENKHNSRKIWNQIKCLSGKDGPEHELQQLAGDSEIVTNQADIAETLNCFFVDGVSAKLLRIAAPAIADSLCKLINFCIDKQTFPTRWKVGKVTATYQGQGNRDDKNNYRPITVLPILSKLLKKHICDHLCDFP